VAQTVAEDLEPILAAAGVRQASPGGRLRLLGRTLRPKPDRRPQPERRAARAGVLMATACLGVAAGAFLSRPPHLRNATAPEAVSAGPAQRRLEIVQAPAPGPLTPETVGFAPGAAAPGPLAPTAVSFASAATPAVHVRHKPKPVRRFRALSRPTPETYTETSLGCGETGSCTDADLLSADRRLRSAYDSAARRGVPRPVLVDYRDRWSSLREHAPNEPGRVVRGYRQMAGELDDLPADRRHADNRAQSPDILDRIGAGITGLLR
jgi:hypothetical protein